MAARNDAIFQSHSAKSEESYPQELVLKRVFDAPRDLVWKVWTDPAHLAQWWGPKGFTNPRCEWDARPGGAIHIDMRAPDGVVYPMSGTMKEVVPMERLVFVSSALDENGKSMFDVLSTAIFADQGGKTALTLQLRVISVTERAPQYLKGMEMGWNMSLDRLAEHVAATAASAIATISGDREIVCARVFDAPRELVWQVFTDPNHITHWWGPRGFSVTTQQMQLKPGGVWRHVMHGPDGRDYHCRIIYREVVEPERLVYEHSPEEGCEPVRMETTVTFTALGDKTRIDFRSTFPSTAERDDNAKKYGAVEGLTDTLARLAELLSSLLAEEKPGEKQ
jgi:uncharacterized protein YndB with AHSA1/START domain